MTRPRLARTSRPLGPLSRREARRLRRSFRGATWAAAAAVVLLVAAAGADLALSSRQQASAEPAGQTEVVVKDHRLTFGLGDHTPSPTAPATPAAPAPPSTPAVVLSVPAVGLSVPVGTVYARDGEITPPTFTSAYVVGDLGVPLRAAASGTVYIVMHSLSHGGNGAGNRLTDIPKGTSAVTAGEKVLVGGLSYTVTGWQTVPKPALATDHNVWTNTPRRLLLITCLEHANGSASTDNLIISATLDGGSS